jgi:hypothetical protein
MLTIFQSSQIIHQLNSSKELKDYPQLPVEAATTWADRFTLHSAGGVLNRAHMPCLQASAVLWPTYFCPFMMSVGDPVILRFLA